MGAELSSKAVFMGNWTGADLMGHLLEGIRASITGIEDQHSDIPPLEGDEDQVVDDFSPMPDMGDQSDQTTLTGTSVHINTSTPSPSLVALPSQATTTTPTLTTSTTPTKQATSRAAPPPRPPPPTTTPQSSLPSSHSHGDQQRAVTSTTISTTKSKAQAASSKIISALAPPAPARPTRSKAHRATTTGKDK